MTKTLSPTEDKNKKSLEAIDAMRISRGKRIECKLLCAQCTQKNILLATPHAISLNFPWVFRQLRRVVCVMALHFVMSRDDGIEEKCEQIVRWCERNIILCASSYRHQRTISGDYVWNARMRWPMATNLNKWANGLRKSRIKLSTMNSCFLIRKRITFFGVCRNDVRKQFRLQFLT